MCLTIYARENVLHLLAYLFYPFLVPTDQAYSDTFMEGRVGPHGYAFTLYPLA